MAVCCSVSNCSLTHGFLSTFLLRNNTFSHLKGTNLRGTVQGRSSYRYKLVTTTQIQIRCTSDSWESPFVAASGSLISLSHRSKLSLPLSRPALKKWGNGPGPPKLLQSRTFSNEMSDTINRDDHIEECLCEKHRWYLIRNSTGHSGYARAFVWAVPADARPYLSQGEGCLSAGAAPHPELSWLHCLTGAFAIDVKAVVGWSTCWE